MKRKKIRKYKKRKKNSSLFRLLLLVFLVIIGFFSIGILNQGESIVDEPTGAYTSSESDFIGEMSAHATELEGEYDVLPSIAIAQGILESDWGRSSLAQEDNNYYGIKGNEGSNQYVTREFTTEWVEVEESFKSYESLEDSMEDHAILLNNGPSWDENLYSNVIEADHYKDAAQALQEAGYATDPTYADKLIQIIERHDLDRFDD